MVYESGFTTRRTYSTRPVVSSYAVSYPSVERVSRVYKSSFPIYSTYTYPKRIYTGSRVVTSPVRIVTSPTRIVSRVVHSPSPVRVVRTTTRVITSPERTYTTYTTPSSYYSSSYLPSTYYSSSYLPSSYYSSSYLPSSYYSSSYLPSTYYNSYVPSSYVYSTPSYDYSPISRIYSRSLSPVRITSSPLRITPSYLKRIPLGYGARSLTNYLDTEPFATFAAETNRIRHRANSLMLDLHTPVIRRSRSVTPFPVSTYEPTSQLALDAYVARVTNPIRHVAKEVHNMSHYPEPAHKYVGKSHLASVRICGDKAYNIRRPMYDSDKVRNDINLMSWYLRHPQGKSEKKVDDNVTITEVHDLDPFRPTRRFSAQKPLEDPVDEETKEKQRLRQERLMTLNEDALDEIELEKKNAQRLDEAKRREEKALEEERNRKAEAEEKKRIQAINKAQAEAAHEAEEAKLAAEQAKLIEEARLQYEREEARIAEEARLAEEVRLAEEEARLLKQARLAEETARKAEEARLAQEQCIREEELNRLAEIERQAEEDRQSELARQAAELAEIARQEAEIAAQELQTLQQTDVTAKVYAEPVIDEPLSPVEDLNQAPIIELSTSIDEVKSEKEIATSESDDEDDEEEEEEE